MQRMLKNLRIAGFDFCVREEENMASMHMPGALGQYNTISQDIVIGKFMKNDQKVVTLLHEIVHCICQLYNIQFAKEEEEFIVDGLARGMFQVLKENPQLIDYLKDSFKK